MVRAAFRNLRLSEKFGACLRPLDSELLLLLKLVQPFVTWGYEYLIPHVSLINFRFPSPEMIHDLVFKHGFMSVDKKKKPLTDNQWIEDTLGEETGIICVEDIVHELVTNGPNFKKVCSKVERLVDFAGFGYVVAIQT